MSELTERMRRKAETNRHARWPADVESCEDELDEGAAEIERLLLREEDLCMKHEAERLRVFDLIAVDGKLTAAKAEVERLTRELDASRKALRELGLDFQRVFHVAKCLYQCAKTGKPFTLTIPYLEEPEAPE